MAKFKITWDETVTKTYSLIIDAETKEEARDKWEDTETVDLDLKKTEELKPFYDEVGYDIIKIEPFENYQNMKKQPIFEYAIYDESDELIDVLNLTKKQAIEYERDNPEYSVELMEDELETDDE